LQDGRGSAGPRSPGAPCGSRESGRCRGDCPYHHFAAPAATGLGARRAISVAPPIGACLGRKEASGYQVLVASPANLGIFFLLQRQVVEGLPGP